MTETLPATTDESIETPTIPDELWDELLETNKGAQKKCYSPEQKIRLVAAYVNIGSLNKAAKQNNIPQQTAQHWKKQPWFNRVKQEVYKNCNDKIISGLSQITLKATQELQDRMEHGEYVYDKEGKVMLDEEGEPRRKKLTAHSLAVDGIAIPSEKRAVLQGNDPRKKNDTVETLRELRKLCHEMGQVKNITPESRLIEQ